MKQPDETHYEARGTTDKLTEAASKAIERGEHLWIATAAWLVSDPTVDQFLLDHENLAMEPVVGCFICEERYTPRLFHRRCTYRKT